MELRDDARKAIDRYLQEVAAHLRDVSPEERGEILQNLESHIHESLRRHTQGTPTVHDVEAVLVEMPPPASYEESAPERSAETPVPGRLCREALWGVLWIPFGLIFVWWSMVSIGYTEDGPSLWQRLIIIPLIPIAILGLTSPFGSVILGIIAMVKIRRSAGRLYGMILAIIGTLFYPLLIADITIVSVVNYAIHETWPQFWVRYGVLITVLTVVMLLVVDVLTAIKLWRVLTRRPNRPQAMDVV